MSFAFAEPFLDFYNNLIVYYLLKLILFLLKLAIIESSCLKYTLINVCNCIKTLGVYSLRYNLEYNLPQAVLNY